MGLGPGTVPGWPSGAVPCRSIEFAALGGLLWGRPDGVVIPYHRCRTDAFVECTSDTVRSGEQAAMK